MLVPVAQDPLIGTKLAGKYEILSVLGTGGMGVVYKGRQDVMDRIVAIKMLQSHHLNDSMSVKRFQQEGRATCKLNHPHIITVYDFGISQQTGQPFIVMDYLQGVPLSDIIKQEGQVSVDRSMKIFAQAADALGHAHKQGIIHRDLKPSNIVLISYDGDKDFVKVVDFGVAQIMEDAQGSTENHQRLTQMGEVCGSPVYMSPEQCQGHKLDQRSDVYSMGIVMYETLTNRLPLLGRTMVETMRKHIEDPPPRFSESRPDLYIPERVEAVILKALAKDPADRHQSMEHLVNELELAIPRPGRSQVLRTTPSEGDSDTKPVTVEAVSALLFKLTWAQWAVVLVAVVTLGALTIVGLNTMLSGARKPAPQMVTEPAAKQTEKTASTETSKPAATETPTTVKTAETQSETTPSTVATTDTDTDTTKTAPPTSTSTAPAPEKSTTSSAASETSPAVQAPVVAKKPTAPPKPKKPKKPAAPQAKATASAKPKAGGGAAGGDVWRDLVKRRNYKTGYSLEQ
jgi:serine/threonine-protein kinase